MEFLQFLPAIARVVFTAVKVDAALMKMSSKKVGYDSLIITPYHASDPFVTSLPYGQQPYFPPPLQRLYHLSSHRPRYVW